MPQPAGLERELSVTSSGGFRMSQGELKPIFLERSVGEEDKEEEGTGRQRRMDALSPREDDESSQPPVSRSNTDFFNDLPADFSFETEDKSTFTRGQSAELKSAPSRDFKRSESGESDKTDLYFGAEPSVNTADISLFDPGSPLSDSSR